MIRFIRIARVARAFKSMESADEKNNRKISAGMQRIAFFFATLLVVLHIFASFWCLMAQFNDRNWMTNKVGSLRDSGEAIEDDDYPHIYVISLYFVLQTITTVGYGDVNPVTTSERIFVIITMIVGVFAFSIISGALTSIMASYDDKESDDRGRTSRLASICATYNIDEKLYKEMKHYIHAGDKIEKRKSDLQWIIDCMELE